MGTHRMVPTARLRARQRFDKYRIEKKLAEGGFAHVYRAYDTIEGIRVALKIPLVPFEDREILDLFRREVRLTTRLDHPHTLPIKDANFLDGRFVIVTALAEESLADRLQRRISTDTALSMTEQMLEGLAHAHSKGVLHCDVKPENVLIFPGNHLRLADFGIARVARNTVRASGSGTLGSMAPEQAMGKPSLRSDVFALGLLVYRLFSGATPEWPFEWPFRGHGRLTAKVPRVMVDWLRTSLEVEPRRRYRDATVMLDRFLEIQPDIERILQRRRRERANERRRRGSRSRRSARRSR